MGLGYKIIVKLLRYFKIQYVDYFNTMLAICEVYFVEDSESQQKCNKN